MFGFGKKIPESPAGRKYRIGSSQKIPRKTPFSQLRVIALDAETSGLDANRDHILSIGLVPIRGDRIEISQRRNWLVRQTDSPNNDAVRIHGIAPGESARGQVEAEVMHELSETLTGAIVVGHHIGFDAAVLGLAFRKHLNTKFINPLIDTGSMAMRHLDAFHKTGYANQRPPTLEELCAHAELPVTARHTASGDAFTTAQVFLWLCGHLRTRYQRELRAGDFW